MEKPLLKDNLLVSTTTETQLEREMSDRDAKLWQSLPCSEGLGSVNPTVQGVSQESEETNKKFYKKICAWTGNQILQ